MVQALGPVWMDPPWLLARFGAAFFYVSLAMVFVECGLFFPFLPGDTLLLSVGVFVAGGTLDVFGGPPLVQVAVAVALLTGAAVAGNVVGYEIGRAVGPPLYRCEGRILKRQYFDRTEEFSDRHGSKALVIGRFVPFVRTYVTVVAGVTRMARPRFWVWSVVGAAAWVSLVTLLGYFLGARVPWLQTHIDLAILAILVLSVVPIGLAWLRHRATSRQE